jgi:hypothetical protein
MAGEDDPYAGNRQQSAEDFFSSGDDHGFAPFCCAIDLKSNIQVSVFGQLSVSVWRESPSVQIRQSPRLLI